MTDPAVLKRQHAGHRAVATRRTKEVTDVFKVVSSEFYFHKPITVHIELYLFYRFIHFLLYIGQY